MPEREDFLMFVVDVLKYDIENVRSILCLLNDRGCIGWRNLRERDFTSEEITSALQELVRRKMVLALCEDHESGVLVTDQSTEGFKDRIDSLWFKLTKRGINAWESWTPPE